MSVRRLGAAVSVHGRRGGVCVRTAAVRGWLGARLEVVARDEVAQEVRRGSLSLLQQHTR